MQGGCRARRDMDASIRRRLLSLSISAFAAAGARSRQNANGASDGAPLRCRATPQRARLDTSEHVDSFAR